MTSLQIGNDPLEDDSNEGWQENFDYDFDDDFEEETEEEIAELYAAHEGDWLTPAVPCGPDVKEFE